MSTKRIARIAMGVALFVVFGLMLQVPVYQNYYVSLGYFVMAIYLYSFGMIDGTIVGTMGVILYCVITGGLRGMPGWTLGNLTIGINLGIIFRMIKALWNENDGRLTKPILSAIAGFGITLSTVMGILIVKSFTEVILYAQPMLARMATNLPATIADIITLILALPVAIFIDKILNTRLPSLTTAR